MMKLLNKEMRLAALPLTYIFIVFGLMAFFPGYPILVGTFFCGLGIFQTFQSARESNDITYSVLLPVAKSDVVRGKYAFCLVIELCYFLLTAIVALLRMTVFSDAEVYRANVMMNANLCYLGYALLIFGLFNALFVGGFFKTAYKLGKPFVAFIIAAFLVIGLGETLIHVPGLEAMNAFGFDNLGLQLGILCVGVVLFVALTFASMRKAVRDFELIDL